MTWREGEQHRTEDGRPMTCDECGKPLLMGEALYSVAYDEEKATGRHWACNVPFTTALQNLRDTLGKAQDQLGKIKRSLK